MEPNIDADIFDVPLAGASAIDAADVVTSLTTRRGIRACGQTTPVGAGRYPLRAKTTNAPVPLCASFIPLLLDGVLLAEIGGRGGQVDGLVRVRFLDWW